MGLIDRWAKRLENSIDRFGDSIDKIFDDSSQGNSSFNFIDGIPESEFKSMVAGTVKNFPDVVSHSIFGAKVYLNIKKSNGYGTSKAEINFGDAGHLTGNYTINDRENSVMVKTIAENISKSIKSYFDAADSYNDNGSDAESENIRFVNLSCSHCGANLEVDLDEDVATCPYCDMKIMIDMGKYGKAYNKRRENEEKQIREREEAERRERMAREETERIKAIEHEKTERLRIEKEAKERENRNNLKMLVVGFGVLFVFLLFGIIVTIVNK